MKNLFAPPSDKADDIGNEKPKILFSCYFSIPDSNHCNVVDVPKNVFLCPGPDLDLDYDFTIKKVKHIMFVYIFQII